MIFWRKKTNQGQQEKEIQEDKLVHHPSDPDLEPSVEYDTEIDPEFVKHELNETEAEVIDEMEEIPHATSPDLSEDHHTSGGGWLSRLSEGLAKSSGKIAHGLGDIFSKSKPDVESLQALEDLLIEADLGPKTAATLVEKLKGRRFGQDDAATEIRQALADEVALILEKVVRPLNVQNPEHGPRTYLICGVNGVGKTTTIGKLAYQLHYKQHKKVMMAAADTFRAAAIDQLQIWAERTKCPLIAKDIGADSAAVAFEAYEKAEKDGVDILMIDTAGRLHNKANLMAELEKMVRVLKKKGEELPHEVILVLDATTGQNAISQVETFLQLVSVTGLVVTKLDGSAKGGVVVALADRFGLPIYAVGVGEDIEDLQPFKPAAFARALVGLAA
jgi:fused signal recognition particle receptor